MKTVLGIVGSPRRGGNTDVLVSAVLEAAREEGALTDHLPLGDLIVRECDGCHVCWAGKHCKQNDDMTPLFERIAASDAYVFGTPVYWYGPTALMKAFIDRLVYFNSPPRRAKIRGKPAAMVVPFEEEDPATADLTVSLLDKCFQFLELRPAGRIIVPGVTRPGEVRQHPEVMEQARWLGAALAGGEFPQT
jgi:multimeric flavodoxin WrbA